jgi:hypothetical protein
VWFNGISVGSRRSQKLIGVRHTPTNQVVTQAASLKNSTL